MGVSVRCPALRAESSKSHARVIHTGSQLQGFQSRRITRAICIKNEGSKSPMDEGWPTVLTRIGPELDAVTLHVTASRIADLHRFATTPTLKSSTANENGTNYYLLRLPSFSFHPAMARSSKPPTLIAALRTELDKLTVGHDAFYVRTRVHHR